jgi:hypothetical protein
MSLVLELQQLAWEKKNDVSDLLKKAYAVAFKLNLRRFKAWAECEMNGYRGKKMPPYRRVHGRVVCHNPYNGWIPFICQDAQMQVTLSTIGVNTPVGVLQEFLQNDGSGQALLHYNPDLENALMHGMEYPFRPALEVPRSAFVFILETVRNMILNWSLKLEADGILGSGLTFSSEEKRAAEEKEAELRPLVVVNISNENNNTSKSNAVNVGQMERSAVQQESPQSEMYFDPDEEG